MGESELRAKLISGQAPGGSRQPLAAILPLATPLVVQMFPAYACNFTCSYCVFSTEKSARGFVSDQVFMDMGLYRKCIADLGRFGEKVKVLRFVGMGEPLLHKNIVAMIECAVAGQVAERVEILTNAFLLAEPLSLALVDAGLSRLIISVQGTNSQKYREVCGVDLDFDRFIENIRFFYAHRGKTQIHIKIID